MLTNNSSTIVVDGHDSTLGKERLGKFFLSKNTVWIFFVVLLFVIVCCVLLNRSFQAIKMYKIIMHTLEVLVNTENNCNILDALEEIDYPLPNSKKKKEVFMKFCDAAEKYKKRSALLEQLEQKYNQARQNTPTDETLDQKKKEYDEKKAQYCQAEQEYERIINQIDALDQKYDTVKSQYDRASVEYNNHKEEYNRGEREYKIACTRYRETKQLSLDAQVALREFMAAFDDPTHVPMSENDKGIYAALQLQLITALDNEERERDKVELQYIILGTQISDINEVFAKEIRLETELDEILQQWERLEEELNRIIATWEQAEAELDVLSQAGQAEEQRINTAAETIELLEKQVSTAKTEKTKQITELKNAQKAWQAQEIEKHIKETRLFLYCMKNTFNLKDRRFLVVCSAQGITLVLGLICTLLLYYIRTRYLQKKQFSAIKQLIIIFWVLFGALSLLLVFGCFYGLWVPNTKVELKRKAKSAGCSLKTG